MEPEGGDFDESEGATGDMEEEEEMEDDPYLEKIEWRDFTSCDKSPLSFKVPCNNSLIGQLRHIHNKRMEQIHRYAREIRKLSIEYTKEFDAFEEILKKFVKRAKEESVTEYEVKLCTELARNLRDFDSEIKGGIEHFVDTSYNWITDYEEIVHDPMVGYFPTSMKDFKNSRYIKALGKKKPVVVVTNVKKTSDSLDKCTICYETPTKWFYIDSKDTFSNQCTCKEISICFDCAMSHCYSIYFKHPHFYFDCPLCRGKFDIGCVRPCLKLLPTKQLKLKKLPQKENTRQAVTSEKMLWVPASSQINQNGNN